MSEFSPGEWRVECVSDACRVVVGQGRQKLMLARLATKQIPESETHANAKIMAASKYLYEALKAAAQFIEPDIPRGPAINGWENTMALVTAALAKADGR